MHRGDVHPHVVLVILRCHACAEVFLQVGVDALKACVGRFLRKIAFRIRQVVELRRNILRQLVAVGLRRALQRTELGGFLHDGGKEVLLPCVALQQGGLLMQGARGVQSHHGDVGAVVLHHLIELHPVGDLQFAVGHEIVAVFISGNCRAHFKAVGGGVRDVVAVAVGQRTRAEGGVFCQIGLVAIGRFNLLCRQLRMGAEEPEHTGGQRAQHQNHRGDDDTDPRALGKALLRRLRGSSLRFFRRFGVRFFRRFGCGFFVLCFFCRFLDGFRRFCGIFGQFGRILRDLSSSFLYRRFPGGMLCVLYDRFLRFFRGRSHRAIFF